MAGVDVILGINLIRSVCKPKRTRRPTNASMSRSRRRDKRMRENANARTQTQTQNSMCPIDLRLYPSFSPRLRASRFSDCCYAISPQVGVILGDAAPYCSDLPSFYHFARLSFQHLHRPCGCRGAYNISWDRDVNDTGQVHFVMVPQTDVKALSTDTTQPDGTLNVTFPTPAGAYLTGAIDQSDNIIAASQTFKVAVVVSSSSAVQPSSLIRMPFMVSLSNQPSSASAIPVQSTATALITYFSTKSVQNTATTPPISSSTYRNHKTPIIIGAVTGSLVSLLIIFGGGTFLYMRKRRHRKLKHRLPPNLKIKPELNLYSPPVGNQNGETITPMLAGGLTPYFRDRSQETVEQGPAGNLTKDEVERRNSISSPAHVNTSEPQAPQQEGPQAALGSRESSRTYVGSTASIYMKTIREMELGNHRSSDISKYVEVM
ncbi:hypothetical protein EDD85DRAFT_797244 [Armillaria nabsnona]|nr:hypothetical protein EDD85DRAFT_797244 [Armillaria nabsnona]